MIELRKINSYEYKILNKLFSLNFFGGNQLKKQLRGAMVKSIDNNGSIRFVVNSNIKVEVKRRIPIEAQYLDSDGYYVHILLHVVDGKIFELEIYKDNSSNVKKKADINRLEILLLE